MKFLIAGAGGLLGSAFRELLAGRDVQTIGREHLDIRHVPAIRAAVSAAAPDVLINCAAHTDVEGAERDTAGVLAANAILPGLLASVCRRLGTTLVHFSSTGCYGNWKDEPYTEEDPVRPTTAHHRSKISGEQAVRDSGCEHLLLRTGWLFGGSIDQPKNFVWKRLLEARKAERMASDASQRGNPTYAPDVARQALILIENELHGTFNVVSKGSASRYEYVAQIVASGNLACKVEPGPSFKRLAPVSHNEVGANQRLDLLGLNLMPDWRCSIDGYVARLSALPEWRSLAA